MTLITLEGCVCTMQQGVVACKISQSFLCHLPIYFYLLPDSKISVNFFSFQKLISFNTKMKYRPRLYWSNPEVERETVVDD